MWHLRLTLHFLAEAGNLLDCACLAGIIALKHFRRPDVDVIGDEITVVSLEVFLPCYNLDVVPDKGHLASAFVARTRTIVN